MITIAVKKIWYGDDTYQKAKITLRSYWVDEAIKKKEDVKVVYEDRSMILTPRKLKNYISKRDFKSKIGAEDYSLLDYFWNPSNIVEDVSIPLEYMERLKKIAIEKGIIKAPKPKLPTEDKKMAERGVIPRTH